MQSGTIGFVLVLSVFLLNSPAVIVFPPYTLPGDPVSDGIVSQQPEYSVLSLKPLFDGTLDQCMAFNQLVLAWSPLAGGKLATEDGLSPELAKVLRTLADRESVDLASICLAFVLAHPSRPVALIGSIDPYHIAASAAALRVNLDRTDVYRIIEASLGEPLP